MIQSLNGTRAIVRRMLACLLPRGSGWATSRDILGSRSVLPELIVTGLCDMITMKVRLFKLSNAQSLPLPVTLPHSIVICALMCPVYDFCPLW